MIWSQVDEKMNRPKGFEVDSTDCPGGSSTDVLFIQEFPL